MLLEAIGRIVSRQPLAVAVGWAALLAALTLFAPPLDSVLEEGHFEFLPRSQPSRQAERLFDQAWPDRRADSSLVILVRRSGQGEELTETDRRFIRETVVPELESLEESQAADDSSQKLPLVADVLTADVRSEELLDSEDGRATLVVVELTTEFLHDRVKRFVDQAAEAIDALPSRGKVPEGLELALTGSATVGRDDLTAREQSGRRIQSWTPWLVISLLLIAFRAPFAALIPLATLSCGITVALNSLALLAERGYVNLFEGIEVYTTVLVYGAGVDYSLFLVSRFQEELAALGDSRHAVAIAVHRVGVAVAASAGTEIFGIGMLVFATFDKFHQAGITIAFGLFAMLCASLTLTPALLCLTGTWTFWPRNSQDVADGGPPGNPADRLWNRIGRSVVARPGLVWVLTVAVLVLPAVSGAVRNDELSYGLVDNLPADAPSVRGTQLLAQHFSPGKAGPITVLLRAPNIDFTQSESIKLIDEWTGRLARRKDELGIAEIRSVAEPLGVGREVGSTTDGVLSLVQRRIARREAVERYVSSTADGRVTRLQLVLKNDPLSRESIQRFDEIRHAVHGELPARFQSADVRFAGATAGVRDLKAVAERDRSLIQPLIAAGVLTVLVAMLRRFAVSVYLVLTVLLTYFVTVGATFHLFAFLANGDFPGLHWTVPLFLFAVLMAVGADYNVLLVKRADEERERAETRPAIAAALGRTGVVISSCGFIMAGTFSTLAIGGSLSGMMQLGFALAFGIILDTFVVRPLLVPSFLALWDESVWHRRRKALSKRLLERARGIQRALGDGPSR
ncbi:MAG: MMPL family transporter [Planctomycetota bacterium]|nr:MAG: MMPL family transporter [Planctomycetota bacterium]REK27811.1 MAG: MMPL family transporter [Planctomycetota bacterium]REK40265.1 MAG: MMPL family transporter [Planctomycetota bacterium]